MTAPSDDLDARTKNVLHVGGWTALGISIATASSLNAIAQTIVDALGGGAPKLDAVGVQLIVGAFLLTAPLAIAVTIAALGLVLLKFPSENEGVWILAFLAVAIIIGLVAGNLIYEAVYSTTIIVDVEDLASTVGRVGGVLPTRIAAGIMWFLTAYYEFYGPGHFFAAFLAGLFAAYLVYTYLPRWAKQG